MDCLNLQNGILDVETKELMPHIKDYFTFSVADYEYNPEAECPKTEAFLNWFTCGDESMVQLILEIAAYCLLLDVQYQKFFWFIGKGANGKSVLMHLFTRLVGINNVSAVPLENLGGRWSIGSMIGKNINIASDVNDVDKIAEGYLKQLCDGSRMQYERKYRDAQTTIVKARLVFCSNNFPYIKDRSDGIHRRLILIPCDAKVVLPIRLYEEELMAELPGLLNLVLAAGAKLLERGDFAVPERCKNLSNSFHIENNSVALYCSEVYELRPNAVCGSSESMYDDYKQWSIRRGKDKPVMFYTYTRDFRSFFAEAIKAGTIKYTYSPTHNGGRKKCWRGLVKLRNDQIKVLNDEPIKEEVPECKDQLKAKLSNS